MKTNATVLNKAIHTRKWCVLFSQTERKKIQPTLGISISPGNVSEGIIVKGRQTKHKIGKAAAREGDEK